MIDSILPHKPKLNEFEIDFFSFWGVHQKSHGRLKLQVYKKSAFVCVFNI